MSRRITNEEAQAWMARWKLVEERQREELRNESYEEKFESLAVLLSADLFEMSQLDEEDAAARQQWAELMSLARGR